MASKICGFLVQYVVVQYVRWISNLKVFRMTFAHFLNFNLKAGKCCKDEYSQLIHLYSIIKCLTFLRTNSSIFKSYPAKSNDTQTSSNRFANNRRIRHTCWIICMEVGRLPVSDSGHNDSFHVLHHVLPGLWLLGNRIRN